MTDTIFALSSGRPPAAVSLIRVGGPLAHEAGRRLAGHLPEARTARVRQVRDPASGELLDECLVLRFDGPASSTGEDMVEFHCHGGAAVVDSLLRALGAVEGLREARPGEFTRRAFENGRIDLTEAEGLADLIEAETEAQRRAALLLAEGGLKKQIEQWRARLVDHSAEAERIIDYDEDDLGADAKLLDAARELAAELRSWCDRPRVELLKDGARVVVAGPPNSGKSSLLNAIAGSERAIVTDIPGTTRDHIDVPLAVGGVPVLLTDTAGLRETDDAVEAIGVVRTSRLIEAADLLLWLGDSLCVPAGPKLIKVHSKIDLPNRRQVPFGSVGVSAVTGEGIGALLERIAYCVTSMAPAEGSIAVNRRQAGLIEEAAETLEGPTDADPVLLAESFRHARAAFDRLTGRSGVEDVLDALFGRFCLGK